MTCGSCICTVVYSLVMAWPEDGMVAEVVPKMMAGSQEAK